MPSLPKPLRNELEKTVREAHRLGVAGGLEALAALAVDRKEAFPHMSREENSLRLRLRAHGRTLGDERSGVTFKQTIDHLAHAVAYEHWHRMLFARFLAENECLIEPESRVAVSLGDIEELAHEESVSPWELAGRYAEKMLPQIFRTDDPALSIALPAETTVKLEKLLSNLPEAVFTANDSLGWVYQFWQTDAKDAANKSGNKIDADTLPAVTQLFTEDYMVDFMLHNTLGAWWVSKEGGRWKNENVVELPYLRLKDDGTPAAGAFEGWPEKTVDLKVLDPCMGSGHFLVALLPLLARMRMAEEGLSDAEAARAVLRDNLHGLELDPRCAQLAGFNLALAAWKFAPNLRTATEPLPPLHLACCGIAPVGSREEWLRVLEGRGSNELRFFLGSLYDTFKKAPLLGSLINPRKLLGGLFNWKRLDELLDIVDVALKESDPNLGDRYEIGIVVHGLAKAIQLLSNRYHIVTTNVPYLARGKQAEALQEFINRVFPLGKGDLATAFVLRIREFCEPAGCATVVTPQNWLFLKSYEKLRKEMLVNVTWDWVVRLGSGAFATITGEVVNVSLLSITSDPPADAHTVTGIDVSDGKLPQEKANALLDSKIHYIRQSEQLENPDARISLLEKTEGKLLSEYANAYWGQGTGDFLRFGRFHWEVDSISQEYSLMQSTVRETMEFGGRESVVFWEQGKGQLVQLAEELKARLKNIHYRGSEAWGKPGVCVSLMRVLPVTRYGGEIFDGNCAAIIPKDADSLSAIWEFCSFRSFHDEVRRIDQKMNVTNHTLLKVPFDLAHWKKTAAEKHPDGLPEPYSIDPTQWLFKGRIDDAIMPLQVAVSRLLGHRWLVERDDRKTGVQLLVSDRAYLEGLNGVADEDGIVCLAPLRCETTASSRLEALLSKSWNLAYQHRYQPPANWRHEEIPLAPRAIDFHSASAWMTHLLERSGARDLDVYLRTVFFEEHCKLFHHRPFIWHIWDGRPDGFHALVNYHKLIAPDGAGRKLLETLTYSYLGDWIRRQRDDAERGEAGAEDRMLAAQSLQAELKNILTGEPPYDIFVRWKPLHQQAIGWEPDINDGVRLNIRPFMLAKGMKKKGAGILRFKPNCKWGKDRGKEPIRPKEDYPWFWRWDEEAVDFPGTSKFDGNRWNACHYTNVVKRAARER